MAQKKISVRKQPRQDRSAATVEAILQAATYILTQRGWAGFTTNAVAQKAGVNIASIYQYFPNKEAIVAELRRRHLRETRLRWPTPSPTQSLRESLRAMLEAMVNEHRVNPELHRVFTDELPRALRKRTPMGEAEARLAESVAPHVKAKDPALAKFIAGVVVHAVIHEAAVDHPEILDHPLFVPELVRVLTAFLSGR